MGGMTRTRKPLHGNKGVSEKSRDSRIIGKSTFLFQWGPTAHASLQLNGELHDSYISGRSPGYSHNMITLL